MSLVVEQTLPYTSSELKVEDSTRWSRLFPLMRPSIRVFETADGQVIVADTAHTNSKEVLVATIGTMGHFSSRVLSESHAAAFTIEQNGKSVISAEEIFNLLKDNGFPTQNGLVVVRATSRQSLKNNNGVAEVDVIGVLKLDHILSLLQATKPEVKASFDKTYELLEMFVRSAAETTSIYHEKKSGSGPTVQHALEIAEFSSAKAAIDKDLSHLLSSKYSSEESAVYSIHFSDTNGLARIEINILAHEISSFLSRKVLPSFITQSTILDDHSPARGWAISLCVVPPIFLEPQEKPSNTLATKTAAISSTRSREGTSKIIFSDSKVRRIIISGCGKVIQEEAIITEYDTIVGDGDCGYTLRDGAKQVMSFISTADLSKLPSTLSSLVDDLEVNMGGTSGALYCIFLSSLAQNLWDAPTFADALQGALDSLLKYTRARLGDRTCLDCLIPFVDTLKRTNDLTAALKEAEEGVETTKKLEAKLGRSSYLDEAATRGVPDPGAYGLLMLLEGMVNVQ